MTGVRTVGHGSGLVALQTEPRVCARRRARDRSNTNTAEAIELIPFLVRFSPSSIPRTTLMPDLNKSVRSGGCQCGALRYALMSELTHTSICWCRMQKASGNYFQAFTGVRAPTLCGPEGNPAPSTRPQPSHETSAVSAAHPSPIGGLRSIASPSP
jgi:hypothetical protein